MEQVSVGSVLLTLVAGLAAIILLGRRQKVGRMSDSAVALSHLLAGQGRPEEERTAEGRELDGIFEENTADIKSDFRRAQEPYLRAHQTLNGSSAERLLDYAEEMKEEGNRAFKASRFPDAAKCYALALLALENGATSEQSTRPSSAELQGVGGAERLECGQRIAMRLEKGAQVEAEGIICCDNEDGTYDIILDDGNDRDAVARAHIRALPKGGDGMEDGFSARRRTLACANWINSARCAYQTGRLSLSAALATRAIDLNPTNPAAFYVRGRARLAIPFLDLAKEDLRQACLVEPLNVEYRKMLAQVKDKIKLRNQSNRETAALMLSYMRTEGVTTSASCSAASGHGGRV